MNSQPRLAFPASSTPARARLQPRGEGSLAALRTQSIPIPSRTHPAASSPNLRSSRRPGARSVRTTVPAASLLYTTLTSQPSTCPPRTHGTYAHGWNAPRAAPTPCLGRARQGRLNWSLSSDISAGSSSPKSADSTTTRPPRTSWSPHPRLRAS